MNFIGLIQFDSWLMNTGSDSTRSVEDIRQPFLKEAIPGLIIPDIMASGLD
jgi:hypothetical protein